MNKPPKLGILGGIAWASTADYYAGLCRLAESDPRRQTVGPPRMPEMVIESLNMEKALSLLGTEGDEPSWARFDAYHRDGLLGLEASGATLGIMAANTPHHRFRQITQGVKMPMVNLFELLAEAAFKAGFRSVTVMGTATTMRSEVLLDAFSAKGVSARFPEPDVQAGIITLLYEIHSGHSEGARARFLELGAQERLRTSSDCFCLACTELPGLFPEYRQELFESGGVRYMDSLRIHVAEAYRRLPP